MVNYTTQEVIYTILKNNVCSLTKGSVQTKATYWAEENGVEKKGKSFSWTKTQVKSFCRTLNPDFNTTGMDFYRKEIPVNKDDYSTAEVVKLTGASFRAVNYYAKQHVRCEGEGPSSRYHWTEEDINHFVKFYSPMKPGKKVGHHDAEDLSLYGYYQRAYRAKKRGDMEEWESAMNSAHELQEQLKKEKEIEKKKKKTSK